MGQVRDLSSWWAKTKEKRRTVDKWKKYSSFFIKFTKTRMVLRNEEDGFEVQRSLSPGLGLVAPENSCERIPVESSPCRSLNTEHAQFSV